METGKTHLSNAKAGTIRALAATFGEPIADLLTSAGVTLFAGLPPEVVQAAFDLGEIPTEERRELLAAISSAASRARAKGVAQAGDSDNATAAATEGETSSTSSTND